MYKNLLLVCIMILITACAGWERGYSSVPYIDSNDSHFSHKSTDSKALLPFEIRALQKLRFPNFSLQVNMFNSLQTSSTGIVTIIPVQLDFEEKWQREEHRYPGAIVYYIRVKVLTYTSGFVFTPGQALLSVDGKSNPEILAVSYDDTGIVQTPIQLDANKPYTFELHFKMNRPSPDHDIKLDITKSLLNPDGDVVPVIHFRKQRYVIPYS